MIKELHIATQYLAAAAISYVEKKDDDSHTNLGWSIKHRNLSSRLLSNSGIRLELDFLNFSLNWIDDQVVKAILKLENQSHDSILIWLNKQAIDSRLSSYYRYNLHYDIGYGINLKDYTFPKIDYSNTEKIAAIYCQANRVLASFLSQNNLNSEIRVWPHHFDLGTYAKVSENLHLGLGLAIPDSKIDEFYFYMSAYENNESIETANFDSLNIGKWQTGEWKAATLEAAGKEDSKVISFMNEAFSHFRT